MSAGFDMGDLIVAGAVLDASTATKRAREEQISNTLKRAFLFIEDEDWNKANEYLDKVLDLAPENADAYLGKLLCDAEVTTVEDLCNCGKPFDTFSSYKKVMRFNKSYDFKDKLKNYAVANNQKFFPQKIYNEALLLIKHAEDLKYKATGTDRISDYRAAKQEYEYALSLLGPIQNFEGAHDLIEKCCDELILEIDDRIRYLKKETQNTFG